MMADVMDFKQISRFFTAMGDPIRLQIVLLLRDKPLNVGEIATQFPISRPAISHHLRVLKEAAILDSEKVGQEVYYAMNKAFIIEELRALADKLEQLSNSR
jgi:ArsR family transcriptional regulator, arsenate/arsenite/antimonite-responsive transcriptional repressor